MKKSTKIIAVLVIVAGVMSSCITTTVLRAKWAVEEEEEIVSGKVFEQEKGTFFYSYQGLSEGLALAFKDYGNTDDGYEVAEHDRIFMYKKENNKQVFKCSRLRSDCALELTVPSDYKKVSGSIDYKEDF